MSISRELLRSKIFYILCITILIILTLVFVRQRTYTPIEIVRQRYIGSAPCFRVNRLLKQIELDDEQVLLFYYNDNNNIDYSLLEKGILGYKLLDSGGELVVKNDVIPADLFFGFYNEEAGWVGCGVVYDNSVAKVIIDENEANIINVEDIRLWYLVGTGEIDTLSTKIIDHNGKEIAH